MCEFLWFRLLTLSGLVLDDVSSVRSVMFGVRSSCSLLSVSASGVANVGGSNNTLVVVSFPTSVGLAPGSDSVCVNFFASVSNATFVSAGSRLLFVGSVTGFSPLTVLAGSAGASVVVTVSGLGLDAVNSVRSVMFGRAGCGAPTVAASSFSNYGGGSSNNTLHFVRLPSVGLNSSSHQVCVGFTACKAGLVSSVGSEFLLLGESFFSAFLIFSFLFIFSFRFIC